MPASAFCVKFIAGDSRNVVRRHDRAQNGGEVQNLNFDCDELLVRHRAIGRAKVNCASLQLANPAARTDRLIVDLNIRMRGVVNVKPFRVNRVGERGAGRIQQHGSVCATSDDQAEQERHNQQIFFMFSDSPLLFFYELLQPCYIAANSK